MTTMEYIYTNINNFLFTLLKLTNDTKFNKFKYYNNKLIYGNYGGNEYPNSNINGKLDDLLDMSYYLHDICISDKLNYLYEVKINMLLVRVQCNLNNYGTIIKLLLYILGSPIIFMPYGTLTKNPEYSKKMLIIYEDYEKKTLQYYKKEISFDELTEYADNIYEKV